MLGHRKLEVADYIAILKRRIWIIAIPALLGPIVGYAFTFSMQPKYQSQTLVLIDQQRVPDDIVKAIISSGDLDGRLASMKEQILSRSRIQPIIDKYNLYASTHASPDDKLDMARKNIEIKAIRSEISASRGLPGFFIGFTAGDPHTAQFVCQEITTLFLNENLTQREASAQGTTDFIQGQLDDAKRALDEQDAKLAAFQRQYFGKLPGEEQSNLNMLSSLNTQLEAANQSLSRMEEEKTYMQSMLTQFASDGASANTASSVPNPERVAKKADLDALLKEEQGMASQYTNDYPDLVDLRKRIAEVRRELAALPANVPMGSAGTLPNGTSTNLAQLHAQMKAQDMAIDAKRREQAQLQTQVHMYQDRIQSSPQVLEQFKQITRDSETAKQFYDSLLAKMNQSKMAKDLEIRQEGEQFRVMDPANLPESPLSPKRGLFINAGFVAGLAIGLLIAALLEYRDTTLRSERDIWAFTQLPTLAVIAVAGDVNGDSGGGGQGQSPWFRAKASHGSATGAHG